MSSELHPNRTHDADDEMSNPTANPSFEQVLAQRLVSRRGFLKHSAATTAGITAAGVFGGSLLDAVLNPAQAAPAPVGGIGFTSVPANVVPMTDAVTVPAGYSARVLVAWGDRLTAGAQWNPADPMDEATQLQAYGAHTDGMHYFPPQGARTRWLTSAACW